MRVAARPGRRRPVGTGKTVAPRRRHAGVLAGAPRCEGVGTDCAGWPFGTPTCSYRRTRHRKESWLACCTPPRPRAHGAGGRERAGCPKALRERDLRPCQAPLPMRALIASAFELANRREIVWTRFQLSLRQQAKLLRVWKPRLERVVVANPARRCEDSFRDQCKLDERQGRQLP